MKATNLFGEESSAFEQVPCDRCSLMSDAYYTLSSLTKGLWVRCKKCGNHAVSYQEGLNLPWNPSKAFIKEVGKEEAIRIALELQQNRGKLQSPVSVSIPVFEDEKQTKPKEVKRTIPNVTRYCDAGTKNNGQKGKQQTILVVCDKNGSVLMEKWIGDYSNNEGEILGIIACLRDYSGGEAIEVRTDSRIATNWVVKGWTKYHEKEHKKGKLSNRHQKFITIAHELYLKTKAVITWIPREENLAGHYIEQKYSI